MSTKIYNAIKIDTANMGDLIEIAKKISEMECKNLLKEIEKKYGKFFQKYKEWKNFDFGWGNTGFKAYCNFLFDFHSGSDSYFLNSEQISILEQIEKKYELDLSNNMKEHLEEIVQEFSACRSLSFFYLDGGHTLMKWYVLTNETEKWILENYPDYHYQNQTDGYTLEEIDKDVFEYLNELIQERKNDREISEKEQELIKQMLNDMAYALYKKRGEDWNKALNGETKFSKASFSYDTTTAWHSSPKYMMWSLIQKIAEEKKEKN